MYVPLETVRHVVSFADTVATVTDRDHFAESCLPRLAILVPCEEVTYDEVELGSGRIHHMRCRPAQHPAPSTDDGGCFRTALTLRPSPDVRAVVVLGRSGRPFSDVERDVLDVVGTPLTSALRRFRERDRAVALCDGHDDVPLTVRERQVVGLVARGRTNVAIAHELAVSPRTVAKHLEHIYRKLEVAGRAAAVARLLR